ncbi:MAG: hypothetical protein IJ312_06015 [Treponema sp.]|nr:hypothetical protein [Treponema sp.]
MKKENFLGKIVQKDYSNELEKIIETKDFSEDVKNLLLAILYKVETSYKDYKTVKRNVETKQEYIERILEIIKNNCNQIIIAKPKSEELELLDGRTFLVDTESKKIICYPIERKLLYCISKIAKRSEIIRPDNYLVSKTVSNIINIGNNINTVEPLRDFNGWSWLIVKKEIENINYNLLYQNLRILVGEKFLSDWVENQEYLIDYYDEFKNELEARFGKENTEKIIELLEKTSVLIECEINEEFENEKRKDKEEVEAQLSRFENKEQFIENLSKEKRQLNLEIRKIEEIISNKELLHKEYQRRNEKLPLEKKIFSQKVLEKVLREEKQEKLEQIEQKNELLNPVKFVEEKTKLEKKYELLKLIDIENKTKQKNKMIQDFQKVFLKCFFNIVEKAETKEEIVDLIYNFRYYNMLPIEQEKDIYKEEYLKNEINTIENILLKKAIDLKIINTFSEKEQENIDALNFIFKTKFISLEDIYMAIIKEKDRYYIEFSENNDNAYEEKFELYSITKGNIKIKLNKKIKVFA